MFCYLGTTLSGGALITSAPSGGSRHSSPGPSPSPSSRRRHHHNLTNLVIGSGSPRHHSHQHNIQQQQQQVRYKQAGHHNPHRSWITMEVKRNRDGLELLQPTNTFDSTLFAITLSFLQVTWNSFMQLKWLKLRRLIVYKIIRIYIWVI